MTLEDIPACFRVNAKERVTPARKESIDGDELPSFLDFDSSADSNVSSPVVSLMH
jgi:hypothetical protein